MRQGKKSWWVVSLLWAAIALPAYAQLPLRVAIEQDVSQVKIGSSTNAALLDASGQAIETIPSMNAVLASAKEGQVEINQLQSSQFCIQPSESGFVFIGEKWYRGSTCIIKTNSGLTAVNYVDMEEYLYSVVGAEMPTSWSLEALKAQAVAARSYVLYQRQNSANAIFDVGDTTRWQVYSGVEEETASTRAAVDSTRGQVITYNGQIINAVFHACAGGYTENVEDVWSSPLPYLRAVRSPDENISECQWTQQFAAQDFSENLGYGGDVYDVAIALDDRGRVATLTINGSAGTMTLSGEDARKALSIRSTLFTIEPTRSRVAAAGSLPSVPTSFQLMGRGHGHGIGMSQWGAKVLADQGYTYSQILSHYYTGITLALIEVQD
ncbi:MAG: SpoIID/LytB domain-containing protein [Elainellaceae cyanobacterium]